MQPGQEKMAYLRREHPGSDLEGGEAGEPIKVGEPTGCRAEMEFSHDGKYLALMCPPVLPMLPMKDFSSC